MRTTLCLALLLTAAGCASNQAPSKAPESAPAEATQANTAPAAQPSAVSDPAAAPVKGKAKGSGGATNKDGKVCRTESVTNTRLKTKTVCLTPDEWTAREEAAKDAFRETNKSPMHPRLDSGG